MRLTKCLKVILLITVVSLVYTHLQMQIFDLAYQGTNNIKKISALNDDNRNVSCDIMKLKSVSNLADTLLENDPQLRFRDNQKVVHITIPTPVESSRMLAARSSFENQLKSIAEIFSFIPSAEARPELKKISLRP